MPRNTHLIPSSVALAAASKEEMAGRLNTLLGCAMDLFTHAKQAHWNTRGPRFLMLHELFEKVAADVLAHSDEIAERAGQLGGEVSGTLRRAARTTAIEEYPLGIETGEHHLAALAHSLAAFGKLLIDGIHAAEEADDLVTADLLTGVCGASDKLLWLVESHNTLGQKQ